MRIIATANAKGGSGKTTTAVNLGAALGEIGKRVLLIDLDPQCSLTHWYGITDAGEDMLDLFDGKKRLVDLVWEADAPGVDVVPSCGALAGFELRLSREIGAETLLRGQLSQLPVDTWDYILIDAPPTFGLLTLNVLTAAHEVLVPVEAHYMALAGVGELEATVDRVHRLNADLTVTGILPCRVSRTRLASEVVEALRGHYGSLVYRTIIRENVRLAEAPSSGMPITQYDSASNGAADYRALALEVIAQEKGGTGNGKA